MFGAELSVTMMTELRGASNAKAKREFGWELRYPSWRLGSARASAEPGGAPHGQRTFLATQTGSPQECGSVSTTMTLRTVYFLSLLFAAFALVPAGAHLAELSNKMKLGATEYQTVQQIYRGWELFGVVVLGALASTLALTIGLRGYPTAFTPALVAFLCIVGTQVVFWTFTFPVNRMTVNWTLLPDNWAELRARWEYSHAASAGLNAAALIALIVSLLRYPPVR